MKPQLYINAILKLNSQKDLYEDINKQISNVQNDKDFYTRLNPIDCYLEDAFVQVLDDALLSMTGFPELASYYLYENISGKGGYITDSGTKKEYKWSNGEEFEEVIYKMIKDKKQWTLKR